jgi:hypothetical protein
MRGRRGMDTASQFKVAGEHIVHSVIDDEVILVNLRSGIYYSLQHTGAVAWQMLIHGMTLSGVTEVLATHYGQPGAALAPGVNAFVQRLLEEELLEVAQEPQVENDLDSLTLLTNDYAPPVLEVYADMQDLLLVDPIHEVDESGWPYPQTHHEPAQRSARWKSFR